MYFAAGVFPFEGVFVYALDAEDGRVVWRNDRLGYLYGIHPHGATAIGGVTPQGYLLIDGDGPDRPLRDGLSGSSGSGHGRAEIVPAAGARPRARRLVCRAQSRPAAGRANPRRRCG